MENHKNSLDCSIPEYVKLDKKVLVAFLCNFISHETPKQ